MFGKVAQFLTLKCNVGQAQALRGHSQDSSVSLAQFLPHRRQQPNVDKA